MTLRLYNTMTRSVEPFTPIAPPRVSLYTCGPTVYNFAHIGNFRTFLFEDLLRRWLEKSGYDVFHVMNLTDVDDKTIKGATTAGVPLRSYVERFIAAFHEDRAYLRIRDASVYPRATDFVPAMIRLVETLLERGVAYQGDDGSVYFAIERFPQYGRLSRLDTRELRTGASERVSADEYAKEDARDFALWKAAKPEDEAVGAAWDTPFGRGRPGWHLECSAMALALLAEKWGGDVLDIHAGGVDLIFPHHEDEIAQSCAVTRQPEFARVWMHGEFLTLSGTKMSKRFGNVLTARDLEVERVDPGAVRLLLFNTHYRQKLDWTDDALDAAREGSRRLGDFRDRLLEARAAAEAGGHAEDAAFAEAASTFRRDFTDALDDDLNAPRGLAALFVFVREANRMLDDGRAPGSAAGGVLELADAVLDVMPTPSARLSVPASSDLVTGTVPSGFTITGIGTATGTLPFVPSETRPDDRELADQWAVAWAGHRRAAKAARDYTEADRIREFLRANGYEVRDGREGAEVVRL
ncbi:MAG: cysteine--tRNA ligase [Gemmatimonadota bacterium]